MENNIMKKVMKSGWYEEFEGKEKKLGRTRKTKLYWKLILNELSLDRTDVVRVCCGKF